MRPLDHNPTSLAIMSVTNINSLVTDLKQGPLLQPHTDPNKSFESFKKKPRVRLPLASAPAPHTLSRSPSDFTPSTLALHAAAACMSAPFPCGSDAMEVHCRLSVATLRLRLPVPRSSPHRHRLRPAPRTSLELCGAAGHHQGSTTPTTIKDLCRRPLSRSGHRRSKGTCSPRLPVLPHKSSPFLLTWM
jgi:hypothetical protein